MCQVLGIQRRQCSKDVQIVTYKNIQRIIYYKAGKNKNFKMFQKLCVITHTVKSYAVIKNNDSCICLLKWKDATHCNVKKRML